jgi:hypothetical protein
VKHDCWIAEIEFSTSNRRRNAKSSTRNHFSKLKEKIESEYYQVTPTEIN